MTSNRDFFSGDEVNADIILAAGAGGTVEAHLLAAGSLVHGDGLIKISGSLDRRRYPELGQPAHRGPRRPVRFSGQLQFATFPVPAEFSRPFYHGGK